jgi:hypothetical protein
MSDESRVLRAGDRNLASHRAFNGCTTATCFSIWHAHAAGSPCHEDEQALAAQDTVLGNGAERPIRDAGRDLGIVRWRERTARIP